MVPVAELVASTQQAPDVAVRVTVKVVREMIDAGHHREALFQLLLVRTAAQGIIENDGGEEDRVSSRIGYRQLLAALGIDGDEPFQARCQALRAFMPALREGCEAVLARAPGLLD